MLGLSGAEAHVRFGPAVTAEGDRRALAVSLRQQVCDLSVRDI